MSIDLTEATVGIWYVTIPNGDWMAAINRIEGTTRFELTYRFRYYKDDLTWDSKDEKNWYRMTAESVERGIEVLRMAADAMATKAGGKRWELLRGSGTLDQFMKQLMALPFVQYKAVGVKPAP